MTPEHQALADELEKALPHEPTVINFVVRWAMGLVEQEREACAQIAEWWEPPEERAHIAGWEHEQTRGYIAAAIRART